MSKPLPILESQQQGETSVGIVAIIMIVVIFLKLGYAIIPAQITDYQLDQVIAHELKKANKIEKTRMELIDSIQKQVYLNGFHDAKLEAMYSISGQKGGFSIHKKYQKERNFFANIFITNKFEGEIKPEGAY